MFHVRESHAFCLSVRDVEARSIVSNAQLDSRAKPPKGDHNPGGPGMPDAIG